MSEHSKNQSDEDQGNSVNSEDLAKKLEELTATLEAERKSKDRILEESKKYKEGFQTYKTKEEEARLAEKNREEERLKKEGQFSTLLEQREQRIKELEGDVNTFKSEVTSRDTAIVNFRKAAAFERAIGGKMKKEAYWNHVDFDSIALNPETGDIDSHSLRKAADGFIDGYKELLDFGNRSNMPNGTPSGQSGKLTHEQWKKLPLAERKKRMNDVTE